MQDDLLIPAEVDNQFFICEDSAIARQTLLGFTSSNMIPPTNASAPTAGGIKWLSVVAMCIPRNSMGFPGVEKLKPE
jgi:hypothetical protein